VDALACGSTPNEATPDRPDFGATHLEGSMTKHSGEHNDSRLLELSNQVSRIAASLAELSTERRVALQTAQGPESLDPPVSAGLVDWVIQARRRRADFFDVGLFADPAWDMLLDLLEAEIRGRRVSVSSLCIAAAVPASTAIRWINAMVKDGLFVRQPDPGDLRRVYVALSPEASRALRRYFAELNLGA
jgi:DNA-binding MarR family transcriptional regulator